MQPERPVGRNAFIMGNPIEAQARLEKIPIYRPEKLSDEVIDEFASLNIDIGVVVAYGQLIPKRMLSVPKHGFINLHGSLLPKYRGASPVQYAILNGDTITGMTVFRLSEKWDAGAVFDKAVIVIGPRDNTHTLLERMAPIGAQLVLSVVERLEKGWIEPVTQSDFEASYAPKLSRDSGHIDWHSHTAARIERMTRAFYPWPMTHTHILLHKSARSLEADLEVSHNTVQISILEVVSLNELPPEAGIYDSANWGSYKPGAILIADARVGLFVKCIAGVLEVKRLKPAGKNDMSGADFVRGYHIEPGMYFCNE